jgi:antitoxin component of RelBE/YafQ-DinJ toxin-antitoxin module
MKYRQPHYGRELKYDDVVRAKCIRETKYVAMDNLRSRGITMSVALRLTVDAIADNPRGFIKLLQPHLDKENNPFHTTKNVNVQLGFI